MAFRRLLLLAALFVFVAGCGSDGQPPAGAAGKGGENLGVKGPTKRTKQPKAFD